MIYFVFEIQFICKDAIFLATTLLWDMNHAGHGIISNKKVLLLKKLLDKARNYSYWKGSLNMGEC